MKVTVIICTYNRCEILAAALRSIANLIVPESIEWDVLVVDNNSSDRTKAVVAEFCELYPERFSYLFEAKRGKSNALNAGVQHAHADVLAFTDDDVTIEPDWLEKLVAPLQDGELAGVGGRVLPVWKSAPPRWLSLTGRGDLAPLAHFDIGSKAGDLAESPFGSNMAVRKSIFERYGGFRTDLGPTTESDSRRWHRRSPPRTSEDTEFGSRLLAAGERLHYEPAAIVHHPVAENRLKKEYFLAWWFEKGRAAVVQCGIPDVRWRVYGIPAYLFRNLATLTLRWTTAIGPSTRFRRKVDVWAKMGEIAESYYRAQESETSVGKVPASLHR